MSNILGIIGVIIFLAGFVVSILPGTSIKYLNLADYVSEGKIKVLGFVFGVIGIALIIISRSKYL